MSEPLISCNGIGKSYRTGDEKVDVLRNVNLDFAAGDTIAFQGVSGSGKSTLLQILGGLMRPDTGNVMLEGKDYRDMSDRQVSAARNRKLGFVYQAHHLLGEFTSVENVAMPLLIRRMNADKADARARELLEMVGLLSCAGKTPAKLSGGERQRVAIARALAGRPRCIIADEPTGNLDRVNAEKVFDLLFSLCNQEKVALVVATHDDALAERSRLRFVIAKGELEAR